MPIAQIAQIAEQIVKRVRGLYRNMIKMVIISQFKMVPYSRLHRPSSLRILPREEEMEMMEMVVMEVEIEMERVIM